MSVNSASDQEPVEVDAEPSLLGSRLGEDWQEMLGWSFGPAYGIEP